MMSKVGRPVYAEKIGLNFTQKSYGMMTFRVGNTMYNVVTPETFL